MKERIEKFLACLLLIPIFFVILLIVALLILMLPIAALISPESIKFENKENK